MKLIKYKYRCSGGNGDYYNGIIEAKSKQAAELKLILKYHSIIELKAANENE